MFVLFYLLLVGIFSFFLLMPCIFAVHPIRLGTYCIRMHSEALQFRLPFRSEPSHWENNLTRKKKYIPNQLFYVLNFDVGTKTDFWPNGIAMYSVFSFLCLPVCFVYCLFSCSLLPLRCVALIFNLNVSAFLYTFVCLSFLVCVTDRNSFYSFLYATYNLRATHLYRSMPFGCWAIYNAPCYRCSN